MTVRASLYLDSVTSVLVSNLPYLIDFSGLPYHVFIKQSVQNLGFTGKNL